MSGLRNPCMLTRSYLVFRVVTSEATSSPRTARTRWSASRLSFPPLEATRSLSVEAMASGVGGVEGDGDAFPGSFEGLQPAVQLSRAVLTKVDPAREERHHARLEALRALGSRIRSLIP